ncbi:MAG: FTR1 family protein [Nocardioides sp.]|uniref:iron uptake transporter permease EfeU n=1 Tax=Nocardioides sp. TaxID=35761 RepID=UPI0039E5F9C6
MLPTFVIGLREGLEAALIVSIIAAFLRRNGASLRGLWIGLTSAIALSVVVGVVLRLVEQSLPQAGQEGMEAVIGLVAVCFVTGMVLWMRENARHLKHDLESAAGAALGDGTTTALSVMVFLAVLREGFETSVFLLSTFQAATSPAAAASGAALGLVAAAVIGYGIYSGGVRLNLARFFKITGVFLVFVAAGLVLSSLRSAHEAGWIQFGQARTVDLSWLAPPGAIRTAVITGVLGMPADPRAVELLGWACYLVPMLLFTYWPASRRPSPAAVPRLQLGGAVGLLVLAAALLLAVPLPKVDVSTSAPLEGGGSAQVHVSARDGTLTLGEGSDQRTLAVADPQPSPVTGADTRWTVADEIKDRPDTLTLDELLTYTGNRVPVGLDVNRAGGPYSASWHSQGSAVIDTFEGGLVAGGSDTRLLLTLTGGGLTSPRVITVSDSADSWQVSTTHTRSAQERIATAQATARERVLWKHWFPGFLLLVAAALTVAGLRRRRAVRLSSQAAVSAEPFARSVGG